MVTNKYILLINFELILFLVSFKNHLQALDAPLFQYITINLFILDKTNIYVYIIKYMCEIVIYLKKLFFVLFLINILGMNGYNIKCVSN